MAKSVFTIKYFMGIPYTLKRLDHAHLRRRTHAHHHYVPAKMMQLQLMRSRRMEKMSAGQIQLKGYLRSCGDIKGLN